MRKKQENLREEMLSDLGLDDLNRNDLPLWVGNILERLIAEGWHQ
jgi:hypothetical protein